MLILITLIVKAYEYYYMNDIYIKQCQADY
jgi:hypothetical protein